jgi:hypothetical protein
MVTKIIHFEILREKKNMRSVIYSEMKVITMKIRIYIYIYIYIYILYL